MPAVGATSVRNWLPAWGQALGIQETPFLSALRFVSQCVTELSR